jgi:hypothetical protein
MDEPLQIEIPPLIDEATLEEALEKGKEELMRDAMGPLSLLPWRLVRSTIAKGLEEGLGAGLMSWLAKGWSAARELHAMKDEEGEDGRPALFKLGEHQMTGTLHPEVTISCGETSFPPFRFDVPVTATINATSLAVRKGHITGLGGGECAVVMSIEYDGNDLTGELPLKTIALPGKYEFKAPGIPIP